MGVNSEAHPPDFQGETMHTAAHYGFLVAFSFSAICYAILLLMLGMVVKYRLRKVAWPILAMVGGLGGFWTLVAIGLHIL
jgi:hypothetical protein